jgi:hypothetical protein
MNPIIGFAFAIYFSLSSVFGPRTWRTQVSHQALARGNNSVRRYLKLIILDPFKDKRIIDDLARARFHIDLIGTILLPVSNIYILSNATGLRVKAEGKKQATGKAGRG